MERHSAFLIVLLAVVATVLAGKLPPNIKRCARSDPQLSECLRDAAEDALPKLKAGLPKLGVQPLDPLLISEMRLTQGGDSPVNLDLTFSNMSTSKVLDGVRVKMVNFDFDQFILTAQTLTPHVLAESKYVVKGKVLLLPISGSGDSTVDLYDVSTNLVMKGKKIKKSDGKEYFDIGSVDAKMTPRKMLLHMDNLFNGDKQLGDAMNKVLSDNWELVYKEISPSLNEAYSELFRRPARALFLHVPIDDIVPPQL